MTKEEQQRIDDLQRLAAEYKEMLADDIQHTENFDTSKLPELVQNAIDLVVAKSPGFSNIGAITTVNFVFTHLVGQLRPAINDECYSDDALTPNYYGILISPSGSGKDSSYNALLKACRTALKLVEETRSDELLNAAKTKALRIKLKEEPTATLETLDYSDYAPFIPDSLNTIMSGDSTRGGAASLLNKFQKQSLGVPSIFMGEFGMDMKNGSTVQELFKLLGALYDMGMSTSPEFKTDESKEAAIDGMFPNFLGHTSPKVIFEDRKVMDSLINLMHTMLARRCWFSMPDSLEAVENNPVPVSVAEGRRIALERREKLSRASSNLDTILTESIRRMLANTVNRIVTFDDDAALLYTDYFGYCLTRSQLMEDSSIVQTEMAGRAFKTGRIAAVWALIHGTNIIDRETLRSSIYFAEYNSRYLDTLVKLTSSQPFILLAEALEEAVDHEMALDVALLKGYITRVSTDFKELLEPMNSHLRDKGVVRYYEEAKVFKYEPFIVVEDTPELTGYNISYTKVPGMSKDERQYHLNVFETFKANRPFQSLVKLLQMDTIYNVFEYESREVTPDDNLVNPAVKVVYDRNQKNMKGSTTIISIDVDESPVPINMIHEYLSEFKHIISTTSNPDNKHKFRIILPVNVALSGEDPALYRYIVKRLSADLLVKADPTCFNPAQPMYSYAGSEVHYTEDGMLYSITDYMTDYANGDQETLAVSPKPRPRTKDARRKIVDNMKINVNQVFDYAISAPMGLGSYSLARAAMHMLDNHFTKKDFIEVITYINSVWTTPMDEERLNHTIIDQYLPQFSDEE